MLLIFIVDFLHLLACNLPIEYCEFSDRFETDCIPYLEKHFPEKLKELIELRENDKNKDKKSLYIPLM